MVTRDDIVAAVNRYVELLAAHKTDALAELFAEDAVQHEPMGVRTNRGREEIRAFFAESEDAPFTVTLLSPITVVGKHAAMQIQIHHDHIENFASSDVFEFDDDLKIVSISAFPDLKAAIPQ